MRLTTVILLASLMQVSAGGLAQTMSFKKDNTTYKELFAQIKDQLGYNVMYLADKFDDSKTIDANFKEASIKEVLDRALRSQNVGYTIKNKTVVLKPGTDEPSFLDKASAILNSVQDLFRAIDAKGKVLDAKGEPLEGATILIKGTNRTAKTNTKGEFMIPNVADDAVLVIRYVGYKTLEISLKGAVMPLEIRLNMETGELEEVKVTYSTGYQEVPKERATGSFEFISGEELNRRTGSDILSRLEGVTTSILFDRRRMSPSEVGIPVNNIIIRGLSTLSDNMKAPLIVVDNFPYDGNFNNINPNDVENITILKDAAASSIWGARAANGVIVITTKKGRLNQKTSVSFNSNISVTAKPDLFSVPRMSSSEVIDVETFLFEKGFYNSKINNVQYPYLTPVQEILLKRRSGVISKTDSAEQLDALRKQDIRNDFERYIYRTAVRQQYALNISGGSDKIAYSLSGGYDKTPGILKGDDYNRITLNSSNSYTPLKNLTLQFGLRYTGAKNKTNSLGNYNSTVFSATTAPLPIYFKLADENGVALSVPYTYRNGYTDTVGAGKLLDWKYRPLDELKYADNVSEDREFILTTDLLYKLTDFLSIQASYQYQFADVKVNKYYDKNTYLVRDLVNSYTNLKSTVPNQRNPVPYGGILDQQMNGRLAHIGRVQLNFNPSWGTKHQLNGLLGAEIRENIKTTNSKSSFGYDKDKLSSVFVDHINSYPLYGNKGSVPVPRRGNNFSKSNDHFISFYGNAAYTYNNRYTISASARRDAANQFGVDINDQWKPFWSAGFSWNISDEYFFKLKAVPYLRLRGNYGYQGNVNNTLSPNAIISYINASASSNNLPYASISTPANPGLSWESIKQLNVAIDFRLAGNWLTGSVDVYQKKSDKLILLSPVDYTMGIANVSKNSANMKGSGVDIELNSLNINKKIQWRTEYRFSHVANRVTDFISTPGFIQTAGDLVLSNGILIEPKINRPPFSIFSYAFGGLDPLTGNPQGYLGKQLSADYLSIADQRSDTAQIVYNGSAIPTVFGSLNNTINYKGISLMVNVGYSFNYYFRKNTVSYNALYANGIANADFSKRWKVPGDEKFTTVPSMIYPTGGAFRDAFYANSSVNVLKGDHIRLKYIQLSYDLNKNIIKHLPFKRVKVYFNTDNIGILWRDNKEGLDPDFNVGNEAYKVPRTFVFGTNINL